MNIAKVRSTPPIPNRTADNTELSALIELAVVDTMIKSRYIPQALFLPNNPLKKPTLRSYLTREGLLEALFEKFRIFSMETHVKIDATNWHLTIQTTNPPLSYLNACKRGTIHLDGLLTMYVYMACWQFIETNATTPMKRPANKIATR